MLQHVTYIKAKFKNDKSTVSLKRQFIETCHNNNLKNIKLNFIKIKHSSGYTVTDGKQMLPLSFRFRIWWGGTGTLLRGKERDGRDHDRARVRRSVGSRSKGDAMRQPPEQQKCEFNVYK